jgi:drug/metabolite transporter (DMT)-like permease
VSSPDLGRAILWMAGTLVSFSAMAVSVRGLAGRFSIFEILSIRSCLGLVVLGAVIVLQPQLRAQLGRQRLGMHLLRNGVHFAAQYAWALALTLLPLATVVSLEFTMPAWATLLATVLLAERLTVSRVGVVVFGIVGVLVITETGTQPFQPAMLIVLGAALGYAASYVATKQLTTTETPFAVVFWMTVMQLPMGLIGSDPAFLLRLEGAVLLPALGIGLSGLAAHYCLSNALRHADASVVVPMEFLRIPLLAVIGWLVYQEPLKATVFLGAAIIVSGVLWNLRVESRRS